MPTPEETLTSVRDKVQLLHDDLSVALGQSTTMERIEDIAAQKDALAVQLAAMTTERDNKATELASANQQITALNTLLDQVNADVKALDTKIPDRT